MVGCEIVLARRDQAAVDGSSRRRERLRRGGAARCGGVEGGADAEIQSVAPPAKRRRGGRKPASKKGAGKHQPAKKKDEGPARVAFAKDSLARQLLYDRYLSP